MMSLNQLLDQFLRSSTRIKAVVIGLVLIWSIVLVGLIIALILLTDRRGQALPSTPGNVPATISLEPAVGLVGSSVTVHGQGWTPGSTVMLYLLPPGETQLPPYASANALVDPEGRFTTGFIVPSDERWQDQRQATVIAQAAGSPATAQTWLIVSRSGVLLTATPVLSSTPILTPTATPTPLVVATPPLVLTPESNQPTATALTALNIRSGPGLVYPLLGLLQTGQTVEVTGRSPAGNWWQIKFPAAPAGYGWLAAEYVTAQNTANIPIVQAPPLPTPPPTATPIPVVITEWRGDYFNNPNLSGPPVLVRNDGTLNFNWGYGAPGPGLPADNFSARWTRNLYFPGGTYRFSVRADDGVRLWIDGYLALDRWYEGAPTPYDMEATLTEGRHDLRLEYYERSGIAHIELSWQRKTESTNQPPQAMISAPYNIAEGGPIALDGRGSRDADGDIVKYEWDFSYDGSNFIVEAAGATGATRALDGPATLRVALRVTDNKGASHIATAQIRIDNVSPTVEAGGPYSGQTGRPITLAGTATDPGPVDQTGLSYRWEFGDGSQGNGPLVSHSYAQAGTYTVRLVVTDKDGAQGSDTATVQVSAANQPPQAVINGPASGLVDQELAFSGSGSSDPDGAIIGYAWEFGDGATANGANATHSYNASGPYQVTLSVTDNGGLVGRATLTVQIEPPAPINQPPTAVINAPATAQVGLPVQFNGSGSSDSDGTIVNFAWDFGDGATAGGVEASHAYEQAGSYPVKLTVTDNGGLTASSEHMILIE